MKLIVFIIILFSCNPNLWSQQVDSLDIKPTIEEDAIPIENAPPTPNIKKDTIQDQPKKKEKSSGGFFKLFTGKPGRAALYSLIIPGGGQFYNRDYWKVPIVWGAEGAAIYFIFENTSQYKDFRDAYAQMLDGTLEEFMGLSNPSDVRLVRDSYRKDMEVSWVVFVALHLLNVFEAFIDRHLMNFNVNENLGYTPPVFNTGFPQFKLGGISINLNQSKKKKTRLIQP